VSILDGGKLPGWKAPKTRGDDLGKRKAWKDGREPSTPWSWRQIKAIRLLADPMNADSLKMTAKKCKCKKKTLLKWLKNPYFVQEIVDLTDHKLRRHRKRMLNALLKRGFAGSLGHQRTFFEITGDLKREKIVKGSHAHKHSTIGRDDQNADEFSDDDLNDILTELTGEP
jgi:hypothetical protein